MIQMQGGSVELECNSDTNNLSAKRMSLVGMLLVAILIQLVVIRSTGGAQEVLVYAVNNLYTRQIYLSSI